MDTDKLYVILIIGMIGIFIYWYQTRLDQEANENNDDTPIVYCAGCRRKMIKRKNKKLSGHSEINTRRSSNSHSKTKKSKRKGKSKSPKKSKKQDIDSQSDDSIPDSIIEARINSRRNKSHRGRPEPDDESEISLESLDTIDRSDVSGSRRDDDTLDMVDGTIDSNADTIDLD